MQVIPVCILGPVQNPISATAAGTGVEKSTAVRSYDCESSVPLGFSNLCYSCSLGRHRGLG